MPHFRFLSSQPIVIDADHTYCTISNSILLFLEIQTNDIYHI